MLDEQWLVLASRGCVRRAAVDFTSFGICRKGVTPRQATVNVATAQ